MENPSVIVAFVTIELIFLIFLICWCMQVCGKDYFGNPSHQILVNEETLAREEWILIDEQLEDEQIEYHDDDLEETQV